VTDVQIGILGCVALLVLLCGSVPVAFAMAIVGFVGFAAVVNLHAAVSLMTFDLYKTFADYSLTVIPLFVLMGQVAFHGGISRRLFSAAYHWLGPLPGGLAMATVGACTAFGAICGSGPATTATMAAVALPEMRRYKYSMELACGTVASGGSIGMMIPPSVVFIVYAIMTEQSIGRLFLAGILPGILTALLFCLTIYWQCVRRPERGPRAPGSSWKDKILSLRGAWETLVLFVAVMGGMFYGFFTPTEGAAVGAAGTILIILAKRNLSFRMLVQSFRETLRTSCMVMIIVAGARVFGHFLAVTQIPAGMATWLAEVALPGWVVISLIVVFYLVAGCFVDALALVLLTIPIFYPVVLKLGLDPIWFGVMIVLVTQMGVITPPVGVCVYVVRGMEREVPLETIFRGSMPFLAAMVVVAILLILVPDIALILPRWIHP
jgi:tripartite ATP-independent transporter DctM subunit